MSFDKYTDFLVSNEPLNNYHSCYDNIKKNNDKKNEVYRKLRGNNSYQHFIVFITFFYVLYNFLSFF